MPGTALRQRAGLYRRVASVPTEGGHHEDRLLLAMADQLEREATELEDRLASGSQKPRHPPPLRHRTP